MNLKVPVPSCSHFPLSLSFFMTLPSARNSNCTEAPALLMSDCHFPSSFASRRV